MEGHTVSSNQLSIVRSNISSIKVYCFRKALYKMRNQTLVVPVEWVLLEVAVMVVRGSVEYWEEEGV